MSQRCSSRVFSPWVPFVNFRHLHPAALIEPLVSHRSGTICQSARSNSVMGEVGSGKSTVRCLLPSPPSSSFFRADCGLFPRKTHYYEFPLAWPWFAQFINLISGANLGTGDGSDLESCTSTIRLAGAFNLDGRRVILIDTPGFDDLARSDTDILKMIAGFLTS